MARLNDDAQWIVLMGFIVSFSLFFLAIVLNQSVVVGQTTAEAVSEFPKDDIRGVRDVVIQSVFMDALNKTAVQREIQTIALTRQGSVMSFSNTTDGIHTFLDFHYNNGVTAYNETWIYP